MAAKGGSHEVLPESMKPRIFYLDKLVIPFMILLQKQAGQSRRTGRQTHG